VLFFFGGGFPHPTPQTPHPRCPALITEVTKIQSLQLALILLCGFFAAELVGAACSHSLSLLADAGHVFSDVTALGITLSATWLSRRSMRVGRSKIELLAASINGIGLLMAAGWVGWQAIARLESPDPELQGLPMLFVAVIGLGVNGINALWLHRCSCNDLNVRSAFLHVLADLVSSAGLILAAIAVAWLHWDWADGAISLLVSSLIILLALPLLFNSLRLLLAPPTARPAPDRRTAEKLLYPSLEELIR